MLKLEDIKKGAYVTGIEPGDVVCIVATDPVGPDALTVYYKKADGKLQERMIFRSDEKSLSMAVTGRPWSFDASGEEFRLALEAWRIDLAYLFDPMMAVHMSNVEPLPHQITAVYESMLPRQPLRYVLADDPGAGKTIMAGLYIRELLLRSDAKRVLIVAPGSLVEQWLDEMQEKFSLSFTLLSLEQIENSRSGNPFTDFDLMVARVDQLSRNEDLLQKLKGSLWDLVVVDEAHKLSAHYSGSKIKKTKRFELGELLGSIARHFLLMTATPHNGKEEDFQLFLSLLDTDRFYGKFRDGVHKVDVEDLMRRMVKEDMLRFDKTRLFPERRAHTINYRLSDAEAALYAAVTEYVKQEMSRADKLDNQRRATVGFALTSLQRRLASSPEAIYTSLKRRREKLANRVREEKLNQRGQKIEESGFDGEDVWEFAESMSAKEYEDFEETLVDQSTASQSIQELEVEIEVLQNLEQQAEAIKNSNTDCKWEQLSKVLQENKTMLESDGSQRKLIIFTEHKDTLNYLATKIKGLLGHPESVEVIHGGVKREDRRKVQELFRHNADTRVLVATDAAGEGVNLQNACLMVNYDLPWNPNRLEQRFGRIHRIGQTEVCHLWNMVANETREGEVFHRLFEKLEVERDALGGRVFDILGEVFENTNLKDLLIEAIRYGSDPQVRARLQEKVEGALDTQKLEAIISRHALCAEVMDQNRLFSIREEMEKAEARKLQPYFMRSFFVEAFQKLEGKLREREPNRYEITHVPATIRDRDRLVSGRDHRYQAPVLKKYERVCFEKQYVRLIERTDKPMADLLHPAHPLMQSVIDLILEQSRHTLKKGAVMIDEQDMGIEPKIMLIIDHAIKEGSSSERLVSRRMQFIEIDSQGRASSAGFAPHLDLIPVNQEDLPLLEGVLQAGWISKDLETKAVFEASEHLVPEHLIEVRARRESSVNKTLAAVHERLIKEINYQTDRELKLKEDLLAGKDVRMPLDNVRKTIEDLTARLELRRKELLAMLNIYSATPVVMGGALVIPAGLLNQLKKKPEDQANDKLSENTDQKLKIEKIAMQAVMRTELDLGHTVSDVSEQKCGWDITSTPKAVNGYLPPSRHIEVKGRAKGSTTITVTRNEILYALNQQDKFILAIVLVDGDSYEGPFYIQKPFAKEPEWTTSSVNYVLDKLLEKAGKPAASTR